jgi:hypothetical protein
MLMKVIKLCLLPLRRKTNGEAVLKRETKTHSNTCFTEVECCTFCLRHAMRSIGSKVQTQKSLLFFAKAWLSKPKKQNTI